MKIITLLNNKGGVAKTTSVANIGYELAQKGLRVLLVDGDFQSNLTKNFNVHGSELTIREVMLGECNVVDAIATTEFGLDVLPSSMNFANTGEAILFDLGKARETRLKKALAEVSDQYDICLIDAPPSLNIIVSNILVASEYVLTPIKIDQYALDGYSILLSKIEEIKNEFNPELKTLGAFITVDENTNVNRDVKAMLHDNLGDTLLSQVIRKNVSIIESTFMQQPVTYYKPNAIASLDYKALTNEITSKVGV